MDEQYVPPQTEFPIASFLIPVYNGETYLAEAIDSALAQTEKNIEIIAIDDGSTDSSREILRRYANQDARVRVFEEQHRGLVATLNRGLEVARGGYICRLDADDIATPTRVEKQMKFLKEHPDYALVGGQVALIDAVGKEIGTRKQVISDAELQAELRDTNPFLHSSVTFSRADALRAGGYDPAFVLAEDYDLWVRMAANHRLANLSDVVCLYRVHEKQVSSAGIPRQVFTMMCIRASLRSVSRDKIMECTQAGEEDFPPVLRRLGFSGDEIAEHFAGGYLYWASRLRSIGKPDMALQLLTDADSKLRSLQCTPRYLAEVYALGTLTSLDARDYSRAARFLLKALLLSPLRTTRRVWNKLSTQFSGFRNRLQVEC